MLYKFFSCPTSEETTARFKQLLDKRTLWAADPRTFNDPFECKVALDLEAPEETRRARFFKDNPGSSDAEFRRWDAGLDQSKWYTENSVRQGILQTHGIACFTRSWQNELFWAHYGRNHTGFCVGFNEQVLKQWSEVMGFSDVMYLDDAPVFRFFHEDQVAFVRKVMFSKSASWAYEEEFRLLFDGAGSKALPFGAIVEVTIGCRASAELRAEARMRLPNPPFNIYEACEIPARFWLNRELMKSDVIRMTSHF